jgi:hypothetical protein
MDGVHERDISMLAGKELNVLFMKTVHYRFPIHLVIFKTTITMFISSAHLFKICEQICFTCHGRKVYQLAVTVLLLMYL